MPELSDGLIAALIGAFGGILLGLAARLGKFCTLGAIEDALYGHDWRGIRMWALALCVAIAGTFLLSEAGHVDRAQTIYAIADWNPIASIVGGLLFGYGMALAGNCGFGALGRLGGGDLRSLMIVLVMGIAAYMTLNGPFAHVRVLLFPAGLADTSVPRDYASLVAAATGLPVLVPALAVAGGFGVFALAAADFRHSGRHLLWGTVAGLAILSGWAGMTWLSRHSFEGIGPVSHTFTAPLGETIFYMMTSSAGGLSFAVGSVLGVLAGSVIGALFRGHFRWEACDDPKELGRQIGGGALMGIGGVTALGCSIGQGLTAFSTLAFSAPVVLASIFLGAALGLRHLIRGFSPAE